jgi:predicted transcriptional regulator with HTH domain
MTELLAFVTSALEAVPVRYMLTGSMVMTVYGNARFTRDIDMVVEVQPSQVKAFLEQCGDRFHHNERVIREEFAGQGIGMFNLIDHKTFYKVDMIVRKPIHYEQVKFGNRRRAEIDGVDVWIISPEDLKLATFNLL